MPAEGRRPARPAAPLPLLFGAALAFHHAALGRVMDALFWPKVTLALLLLGWLAAGAGALAAALFPGRPGWLARRGDAWHLAAWAVPAAVLLFAAGKLAPGLPPGKALGVLSFPAWFLALLALPFLVAGARIAAWAGAGEGRRIGWMAAGAGLGLLAFALLPGAGVRIGSPRPSFEEEEGSAARLSVDRGLREDVIAPRERVALPFALAAGAKRPLDVLLAGFPDGPVLQDLLERRSARFTILESDAALIEEVVRRWPALAEAVRSRRAVFVPGSPRWALERRRTRYDLIVLAGNLSYAAALSGALNFRPDHRYTVEAFRAYLAHLRPTGYLFVQRNGMGRVVSTLREASGDAGAVFARKLVVLGGRGRLVSQCWFRPAGFVGPPTVRALRAYLDAAGGHVLYRPGALPRRSSFYHPLVTGARVKGLYFSTPLDLSPATDRRPFFDHLERLMISPTGRPLPEELDPVDAGWVLRIIPGGDWPVWAALFLGLFLAAAGVAAAERALRRAGAVTAGAASVLPTALFLGIAASFSLDALGGWGAWLAPTERAAGVALAAGLGAFGLAWSATRRSPGRLGAALLLAAALAALLAAAGYRAAPAVPALGAAAQAAAVILASALVGAAAGAAFRSALIELEERAAGCAAACAGVLLLAAAVAGVAAQLLAVTFGYPLLFGLACVALLAALRRRRFLPAARPT